MAHIDTHETLNYNPAPFNNAFRSTPVDSPALHMDYFFKRAIVDLNEPMFSDDETPPPVLIKKKRKLKKLAVSDTDIDITTITDDEVLASRCMNPSPPATDCEDNNTVETVEAPVKARKLRQSSLSVLDPISGERKFMCAVDTCRKEYKNANGLKYHLSHAHPTGQGVPEEYRLFQQKKEDMGYRPFECQVLGCQKRYKVLLN